MSRKWMTVFVIAAVMLVGYTARIYGVTEMITKEELQNPNIEENKMSIARKVLADTERAGDFELEDVRDVNIAYDNIYGQPTEEAFVNLDLGPKNSIVAIYTPEGENYKYLANLGDFYDVSNLDFKQLNPQGAQGGRQMVVLDEYVDERTGSFEQNVFKRVYLWRPEDNVFDLILSTPKEIDASWNVLWEDPNSEAPEKWNKIVQTSEEVWKAPANQQVDYIRNQRHLVSEQGDPRTVPTDEQFRTVNERTVRDTYHWSDKWQRFILGEKIENSTGETVAVLEDFNNSPYSLLGIQIDKNRIVRNNGQVEIVDSSTLGELTVPQAPAV